MSIDNSKIIDALNFLRDRQPSVLISGDDVSLCFDNRDDANLWADEHVQNLIFEGINK